MKEFGKLFVDTLDQRLKGRLGKAFSLSWLIINWKIPATLLFPQRNLLLSDRMAQIDDYLGNFVWTILAPAISAVVWVFIAPLLEQVIRIYVRKIVEKGLGWSNQKAVLQSKYDTDIAENKDQLLQAIKRAREAEIGSDEDRRKLVEERSKTEKLESKLEGAEAKISSWSGRIEDHAELEESVQRLEEGKAQFAEALDLIELGCRGSEGKSQVSLGMVGALKKALAHPGRPRLSAAGRMVYFSCESGADKKPEFLSLLRELEHKGFVKHVEISKDAVLSAKAKSTLHKDEEMYREVVQAMAQRIGLDLSVALDE